MNGSAEETKARQQKRADFRKRLGIRIRDSRSQRGLSQERLALDAGLTQFQISGIESGQRNPSATTLWAIAIALDVSLSELLREL